LNEPAVDTNLIQLDTDDVHPDDDLIFEDFARLRLKGHEGDDAEA
jgi:beta-arrestin